MLKVMIVDDEYLLRELIIRSINWEGLGFEIVSQAEDGEQALQLVEQFHPHLMLVDINMPFVNGLDLSKIIRERYPDIKIIILTGYGEFEYAKEAIKLGVFNYLVKPINSEEFYKVLLDVKQSIQTEIQHREYIKKLESEIGNSSKYLKEKYLLSLLDDHNEKEEDQLQGKLKSFGINLVQTNLVVVSIKIDDMKQLWKDDNERRLWLFAVHNIADEIISAYINSVVFIENNVQVVAILNQSHNENQKYIEQCYVVCERVRYAIKKYLNFTVTIGIGGRYNGFSNIHNSYKESMIAIENKFLQGNDIVIDYLSICDRKSVNYLMVIENKDQLLVNLRTGNFEKTHILVENIFKCHFDQKSSKQSVQHTTAELISILSQFLSENRLELKDIVDYGGDILEQANNIETFEEIKKLVLILFLNASKVVFQKKGSKAANIVDKAKTYIEENYFRGNILLEEIAAQIFVNPSYLSKLFKKECKISIIEYLTETRIRKAKEIADNNHQIKVNQLAEMVGYSDPFYFSKLFRKQYGIPPTKYLEKRL